MAEWLATVKPRVPGCLEGGPAPQKRVWVCPKPKRILIGHYGQLKKLSDRVIEAGRGRQSYICQSFESAEPIRTNFMDKVPRRAMLATLASVWLGLLALCAAAQVYPTRAVRLVVPFA